MLLLLHTISKDTYSAHHLVKLLSDYIAYLRPLPKRNKEREEENLTILGLLIKQSASPLVTLNDNQRLLTSTAGWPAALELLIPYLATKYLVSVATLPEGYRKIKTLLHQEVKKRRRAAAISHWRA